MKRQTPKQAMQLTAVSVTIDVWDDFDGCAAGDALPDRRADLMSR
jgi:hypothetical protein